MAGTATPIFPQTVKNWVQSIANADGQTVKTLVTGGANGSKLESLIVSSSDSAARDFQLSMTVSSVSYVIGTITIPINAGTVNSAPSVDILRNAQLPGLAYDPNGNKYLYVASGSTLTVQALTTVTSGKTLQIVAQGGDF